MFRVFSLCTLIALALPGATFASDPSAKATRTKSAAKAAGTPARKIASEIQTNDELEAAFRAEHAAGVFQAQEKLIACVQQPKNPPASPSPTWFNCPQITVHCVDANQIPGGGGAACQGCDMYLTKSQCTTMGYVDGQRITKEDIKKKRDHWKDYDPTGKGPFTIWGYCSAIHENEHEYDFNFGPKIRGCQTEINAYNRSIECLQYFKDKLCPGDPQGAHWNRSECKQAQKDIDSHKEALQYNQCICGVTCPAGQAACDSCKAACKVSWPTGGCDSTNKLYCPANNPGGESCP